MKITALLTAGAVALGAGIALAASAGAEPAFPRDWDMSQTRSAGHYTVVGDGLHIWTDDASSQAKVAGYRPVRTTLQVVGTTAPEPALTWTGTTPQPGFQVVITAAGKSRILVGEPVYGLDWWMSDSSCDTWCDTLPITWRGGGGSRHSAQLNEWARAIPDATVTAIGFSLGSGVKGDGTIGHLSFLGKTYNFKPYVVPTKPTVTIPPRATTTTTQPGNTTFTPPPTGATTTRTGAATSAGSVQFANCAAVQAAGKAPLRAGTAGYRLALDADRDGLACETETSTQARAQARAFDDRQLADTGVNTTEWTALAVAFLVAGTTALVFGIRRARR